MLLQLHWITEKSVLFLDRFFNLKEHMQWLNILNIVKKPILKVLGEQNCLKYSIALNQRPNVLFLVLTSLSKRVLWHDMVYNI